MDQFRPPHVRRRCGVSRLELLVVTAVVVLLAALIVPAVQRSREQSRQATCKTNLKQIGLGLHNYADTYNERMPPSLIVNYAGTEVSVDGPTPDHVGCVGWSWRTMIVPFMSCHPVYNRIDFGLSIGETQRGSPKQLHANNEALGTVLPNWICPSDERPSHVPLDWSDGTPPFHVMNRFGGIAATSYFGNGGSFEETLTHPAVINGDGSSPVYDGGWANRQMANGVFVVNGSVTLSDIGKDGTSNTIGVGEVSGRQDPYASRHAAFYGSIGRDGKVTPSVALSATRTGEWRMNASRVGSAVGAERGFSSEHQGGASFLMMDGTVRFISKAIQLIPAPGLAPTDPRRHAGCDWGPVTVSEMETRTGRCGTGVYGVKTDSAGRYMELNYGPYQGLFSLNDKYWGACWLEE